MGILLLVLCASLAVRTAAVDLRNGATADSVNGACQALFGSFFRFVPGNDGFLVGDFAATLGETEVDGVRIAKGSGAFFSCD